ncbi:MAG: TIGR02757 family protein [Chitinispirillales bacterium]|nr:TIGR02757 family protein [Chitinispirillales bacterium]
MLSKVKIESIYRRYHHPRYLGLDPLVCVRRFGDNESREAVGLFSAALAYGRVEIIVRNINLLIDDVMGGDPVSFIRKTTYKEKLKALAGFKHRFNDGEDVAALLEAVKIITSRYGSLGGCFSGCLKRSGGQFKPALTLFTDELKEVLTKNVSTNNAVRPSFEYLIPSPTRGSACKRMALYLRWMIRKDDGIDLGVWKDIPPSILLVPVDTHVAQIARHYGLTTRNAADWKMAEEITSALRKFDPDDPVRYDFSLCHAGMINYRN